LNKLRFVVYCCCVFGFIQAWEGHLGVFGTVAVSISSMILAVSLLMAYLRPEGDVEADKLLRRLAVFLVGGFICPRCGDAKVMLGGYAVLASCPGCGRLFFAAKDVRRVRDMWRLVWSKQARRPR
jgi:ribosomal protein S27AE